MNKTRRFKIQMKNIKEYFNNLFQNKNKIIDLGKVKELKDMGLTPAFILNNKQGETIR